MNTDSRRQKDTWGVAEEHPRLVPYAGRGSALTKQHGPVAESRTGDLGGLASDRQAALLGIRDDPFYIGEIVCELSK